MNISMLLRLRKIVFYILLLLYFTVTPYVILYALGYVLNPLEGEILRTGLISIETEPRGATVYLGGKKFSHRTPTVLRDLIPGFYPVRIARKGFQSWEKAVEVAPERAVRLAPVLLLPERPETETVSSRSFQKLLPYSTDFKLLALEGDSLASLWKIDLLFRRETRLGEKIPGADQIRILEVHARLHSSLVIFKVIRENRAGFMAFDLEREKEIRDLTPWLGGRETLEWDPRHSDYLHLFEKGNLSVVDLERGQFLKNVATGLLGFGVQDGKLYQLSSNRSLVQANLRGENPEIVEEAVPEAATGSFCRIEPFKRDLFQRNLFVFLTDEGRLSSTWPPFDIAVSGVRGFRSLTRGDSDKILFWKADELFMTEFSTNAESDARQTVTVSIAQGAKDIRQVFWAYDGTHALFLDGDQLKLAEAGGVPPYRTQNLEQVRASSETVYHESSHSVYFLSADQGRLLRRKIVE